MIKYLMSKDRVLVNKQSLYSCGKKGVVVSTVKKAKDSNKDILRIRLDSGESVQLFRHKIDFLAEGYNE